MPVIEYQLDGGQIPRVVTDGGYWPHDGTLVGVARARDGFVELSFGGLMMRLLTIHAARPMTDADDEPLTQAQVRDRARAWWEGKFAPVSLAEAQAARHLEIEARRDRGIFGTEPLDYTLTEATRRVDLVAGTDATEPAGTVMDVDLRHGADRGNLETLHSIATRRLLSGDTTAIEFVAADNATWHLSPADMAAAAETGFAGRGQVWFARAQVHKRAMDALATVAAVLAYDDETQNSGWPE